jgi:magnesium chelatase subunit I
LLIFRLVQRKTELSALLNLERALSRGEKVFEPGLLARANRGYVYIDEVNLLEDHLVDLLLDVAASGENIFERDGVSTRHPARFVLIGSGNPEEGDLRPQLLDRFELSLEVKTPQDVESWVEIVKRREAYDRYPEAFNALWHDEDKRLRKRVIGARRKLQQVATSDAVQTATAKLCLLLKTDGLRGQLTLLRAARALVALERAREVSMGHIRQLAIPALRHRLRRNALDDQGSIARIARSLDEALGPAR